MMYVNKCSHSARIIARRISGFAVLMVALWAPQSHAEVAFKIAGKPTSLEEVAKEDQASFYELDKKRFELVDRFAKEKYLDYFWQQQAKDSGKSVSEAKKAYEAKHLKVSDKEVKETLEKFKDHPSLAKLDKKEQERQIRDYLADRSRRDMYENIVLQGQKKGDLVIVLQEPAEPIYQVPVTSDDVMRFGPDMNDTKPVGCKGDDCAITIIEYSEFQCPFCAKVLPDVKRILTEYKGKIRWAVRDFPLSFHDRARPAAIAARCAAQQGKYWNMYQILFDNQKSLADADLKSYADKIGLDKGKFESCFSKPQAVEAIIDRNFQSGAALGVSGTPAFFINGRRLSGALPYAEFKRVIDDELSGKSKKKS